MKKEKCYLLGRHYIFGDLDVVHTHKVAPACLGFESGVGDFRYGRSTDMYGNIIHLILDGGSLSRSLENRSHIKW